MALTSSGLISLSDVNVELGLSSTAQISLNDAAVRGLFGVASGAISMSNGYGKANQFAFSISSNQTNANLKTLATNAGWNGVSKVVATINSGIYISSNSTGTPALTVSGSFPGGLELINNGYIVGDGGNGGNANGGAGGNGGLALSVSTSSTITNNGTIAGGGGGGRGGNQGISYTDGYTDLRGGGGGGGGGRSGLTNSSGGGGAISSKNGAQTGASGATGGAGTVSSAGAGGAGGYSQYSGWTAYGGAGNAGGGWGAGGGGGGSSGGFALTGNSNITWVSTGTRLGGIS